MNDRCFTFFADDDNVPPPTSRAPATVLAQLVAQTVPPADEPSETATPFTGDPAIELIAVALGADVEAITLMRALYANGETERALAFAGVVSSSIGDAANFDPYDSHVHLIDVDVPVHIFEEDPPEELGDEDVIEVLPAGVAG